MGIFGGIEDNMRNMGGGLFLDAGKGLAKLGGKAVKAGVNAAKESSAKAKERAAEEADDDDDAIVGAGPAFCPHCGKPLR
jgi:hypothetical protein